jgi:hypothetical protein
MIRRGLEGDDKITLLKIDNEDSKFNHYEISTKGESDTSPYINQHTHKSVNVAVIHILYVTSEY